MIKSSYDLRSKTYDEHMKQIKELEKVISFEKENVEFCIKNAEMRGCCLDLGCGPGTTSDIIAMLNNIERVMGVDYDKNFIKYANSMKKSNKICYVNADCYDLPFPDDYFDSCYARYLFQHLKYPEKALDEIIRVVKNHGVIGIHDIDYDLVIHAPKVKYSDRIKKINTRLKAYYGSDMHIGRKIEQLYYKTNKLKRIRVFKTVTNSVDYPEFKELFCNMSNGDLDFLLRNGLFTSHELHEHVESVKAFLNMPDSFYQIGNYFTYGEVFK